MVSFLLWASSANLLVVCLKLILLTPKQEVEGKQLALILKWSDKIVFEQKFIL